MNKTQDLACFLLGNWGPLDFIEPAPSLVRSDSRELRRRILKLSVKEARELGIGRSALHYLRKNARDLKPFRIYQKFAAKLESKFS